MFNTLFYGISSAGVLAILCCFGLFIYAAIDFAGPGSLFWILGVILLIFIVYNGVATSYLNNIEKLRHRHIEKKNILMTLENINLKEEYKFKLLERIISEELLDEKLF